MAKKGGPQPGAGRPKGSTTKPRLSDFLDRDQVSNLVAKAYQLAEQGNETMLKFVLEHHFGKAMQPVEGDIRGELKITFDGSFKE